MGGHRSVLRLLVVDAGAAAYLAAQPANVARVVFFSPGALAPARSWPPAPPSCAPTATTGS